jgi:SAM-dependent methyltransferase
MSLYFAAAGASVTAVDRHASRIEVGRRLAQANRLPATFVVCDMRDLEPLPSARYDLLVCNNALCYIVPPAERRAALSEALRVTRTGGWLIVRNPSRSHPLDPFTGLPAIHFLPPTGANRLAALLGRRRSYVRLLSPRAARRELERAGFVAVRHVSPAHTPRLRTRFARYQHLIARRSPWSAYP